MGEVDWKLAKGNQTKNKIVLRSRKETLAKKVR